MAGLNDARLRSNASRLESPDKSISPMHKTSSSNPGNVSLDDLDGKRCELKKGSLVPFGWKIFKYIIIFSQVVMTVSLIVLVVSLLFWMIFSQVKNSIMSNRRSRRRKHFAVKKNLRPLTNGI